MSLNHKTLGLVEGDDFFIALLKIWLSDEPVDSDLKNEMLRTQTNNAE